MDFKRLLKVDFKSLFSLKSLKKLGYFLAGIALIFGVIIAFRSCGTEVKKSEDLYFIGRDPTFYPLQLSGKERSFLAFTNDFFAEVAADAHLRFEWIDTSPNLLMQGLDNGHFDAAITSLRPHIVNEEKYIFSEMYFELGPVLVVHKNSTLKELNELKGHTIGVYSGLSLIFNAVRETGANIYSLTFVTYPSNNKVLEALEKGVIDAAIIPAIPAYTLIQSFYSKTLKIASSPLADEGLRLVALKSPRSERLINAFDANFEKLTDDGAFKKFIQKWGLIDPSDFPPTP